MKFRSYLRRSLRAQTLLNLIAALRRSSRKSPQLNRGFTLTEVLVATIIGALIVSGLLTVMVELLTSDAREAARSETQREMQLALDYISTDLREAVYVYDGDCMAGVAENPSSSQQLIEANCSGLFRNNHVRVPENSTPVLAFWKLDDLPDAVKDQCAKPDFDINEDGAPPCVSGRAYTLVVYYLTKNDNDPTWAGKARIQRFTFSRFNNDGSEEDGYVNPGDSGFESWPEVDGTAEGGARDLSSLVTLVDFVDSRPMTEIEELGSNAEVQCPGGYALTPNNSTLTDAGFVGVRNFYACIRIPNTLIETGPSASEEASSFNQKVILFIRGNAEGKPGIQSANEGFMPAIQTQVLNRGVANKVPRSQ